jgi:hypothetical protein
LGFNRGILAREAPQSASLAKWQEFVEIGEYFHIFLHSFTFAVSDAREMECEIARKIKHFEVEPGWRNWQTQRTQNPPDFGPWGFDSPSRHHTYPAL